MATGALDGLRVVLTRPAGQAEGMARALAAGGAAVRVRPLVRVAPPADVATLIAALARLGSYDRVAFTSANAVRACVEAAPASADWPEAACVGTATAAAAAAAGLSVTLVPEVFTGEALAGALLRARPAPRRVFWPRASGAAPEFAQVLRAAGVEVVEAEAYRTVPDPGAAAALWAELETAPADVLVFTAPSAVRTFAAARGGSAPAAVAVIGSASAAAVVQAGWTVQVQPRQHTADALVEAIAGWWGGRERGGDDVA